MRCQWASAAQHTSPGAGWGPCQANPVALLPSLAAWGCDTPPLCHPQVLTELKSDNQRLKDENGALIRVISKLSK